MFLKEINLNSTMIYNIPGQLKDIHFFFCSEIE